jgi:hypothetical protein
MTTTTGTGGSTGTGGTTTTGTGGTTTTGSGGTTMGGSGGTTMDAGGGTGGAKMDAGGADMGGGMLSFATDVKPILTMNCAGCHGTDGGLSVASLATVMAATTTNCAKNVSKKRVVPGDPTMSFLYLKISMTTNALGTGCGMQMPRSGPPYLSTADQNTIKNWIMQGANP